MPKDELHVALHFNASVRAGFKPPFRAEYTCILAKHLLAPQQRPYIPGDFRSARDKLSIERVPFRWDEFAREDVVGRVDAQSFVDDSLDRS
jgi:hypothetical protein